MRSQVLITATRKTVAGQLLYITDFELRNDEIIAKLDKPNFVYGASIVARRRSRDVMELQTVYGPMKLDRCQS
jgi:hypothetical protein